MRVTIAASGQGRFKEELDFANDCKSSGYKPILLVLDPTSSARLDELIAEYSKYDGLAFVGNDAWSHIENKAGPVMGKFVEKYVRVPLREVDSSFRQLEHIQLSKSTNAILIQIGNQSFSIARTAPQRDYQEAENDETADSYQCIECTTKTGHFLPFTDTKRSGHCKVQLQKCKCPIRLTPHNQPDIIYLDGRLGLWK